MSRRWARIDGPRSFVSLAVILLSFAAMMSWFGANGGHALAGNEPAARNQTPPDSTTGPSGLSRWVADLYHANLYWYGVLVVVVMAGMGAGLGYGMDRVIRLMGIYLGRLERRE